MILGFDNCKAIVTSDEITVSSDGARFDRVDIDKCSVTGRVTVTVRTIPDRK